MKKNTTYKPTLLQTIFVLALLFTSFAGTAQNLLRNSGFTNGSANWTFNSMGVETNPENVYGGSSNTNMVAEVDKEVGLRQRVAITKGLSYRLSFNAFRRLGTTPSTVGIFIRVIGTSTDTRYVNTTQSYSNTTFSYTSSSYTFSIPDNSSDTYVIIEITNNNNNSTYGVIMDDFVLTATLNASLPVSWGNFTGVLKGADVVLNWNTYDEKENAYFNVERSVNGGSYQEVGRVTASQLRTYMFTDKNAPKGILQYRLRQVDNNGANSFSKVILVKTGGANAKLQLVPVGSGVQVTLSADRTATAQVKVVNAQGVVLQQQVIRLNAGTTTQQLNSNQWPAGVYFVHTESQDGQFTLVQSFMNRK